MDDSTTACLMAFPALLVKRWHISTLKGENAALCHPVWPADLPVLVDRRDRCR